MYGYHRALPVLTHPFPTRRYSDLMHGRLEEALTWFNVGLTVAERESPGDLDIGCLNGRFRVRRALGMPLDRLDELCEERRAEFADELDDRDLIVDAPEIGRAPV